MTATHESPERKTILVVDDEDGPRETLRQILRYDYDILLADGARGGLEVLEREHVDLLISNIRMPDMSGLELLERVQKKYSDLPVLLQTGINDLAIAVKCIRLGAFDFIVRPLEVDVIRWVAKCALAYGAVVSSINTDFDNDALVEARKYKWANFKKFLNGKSREEISAVCDELSGDETHSELMATLKTHLSSREKTILCVDDDPTILSLEKRILNSLGYNVLLAEHGGVALEVLAQNDVDLLITGIKMGVMDGDELLQILQEQGSEIPVIVLSAYATVSTAIKCMELGAFDYIPKPFKIDELKERVSSALAYGESKNIPVLKLEESMSGKDSVPGVKQTQQTKPLGKTILVADDDPTILSLLNKVLISQGYVVLLAEHGGTALVILEKHRVDLLLTNKKMEPVDGIQLLKIVRDKYPDMPAILLTAYPTVATIHECDKLGVFDYMAKPFKIDSLLLTVNHALVYAEGTSSSSAVATHELAEALQYKCHHMRTLLRKKEAEDLKRLKSVD